MGDLPDLYISYYSRDWRGSMLSNLHPTPFILDDIRLACVESLVQACNFPEDDWRHVSCFELSGPECKAMMYEAHEIVSSGNLAHWKGRVMRWGGDEHDGLLRRGLMAKFSQSEMCREALEDTMGMNLIYDAPDIDYRCSYPPSKFVDALRDIRASLIGR